MKKQVLYGVANYQEVVLENGYFVDKTHFIEQLEMIKNPVFYVPDGLENPCFADYWNAIMI